MLGQTAPALIEFFDDRGDGERILGALFIAAVHDETHVRNTLHGASSSITTTMRPVAGSVWCTSAVFEDLSAASTASMAPGAHVTTNPE